MVCFKTCCICCTVRTGTFIIAIFSLIGGFSGTIYFGVLSAGIWALFYNSETAQQAATATRNPGDEEYWKIYDAVKKWHKDIFGIMVAMAIVHAITFITACMLIHGARKWRSCLMTPWLACEVFKMLFSIGFGIALIVNASSWAVQLGQFVAAAEDYLRIQLMAQGAGLIVGVVIGLYFFFVVVSHWQQVKLGQHGQDQVKPMPVHY